MKTKKILATITLFTATTFLSGCQIFSATAYMLVMLVSSPPEITFSPAELPPAHLNQPYQAEIEIRGGRVIGTALRMSSSDDHIMLKNPCDEKDMQKYNCHYNQIIIKGTPTSLTPVNIKISGATYGTNMPGVEFEEEYTLQVIK